jgi:hypothetical protein
MKAQVLARGNQEVTARPASGVLQRAAVRPVSDDVAPSIVYDVLHSPGKPLDAGTRAFAQTRFGHDFSHVRVHTDARAAESAQAVDASAYTVGRDVVFAAGEYAPDTATGQQLLMHELTHTLQQERQPVPGVLKMDSPAGPAEQEAQQMAGSARAPMAVLPGYRPASPTLQRQKKSNKASDVEKRLTLLENQQKATSVLLEFENQVQATGTGWEDAVLNIGSAYALAARRHQQAISTDNAHAAIETQLMLAVLTSVTAGAFGWIVAAGSLPRGASEAELLGSRLQTAAEGGVEKVIPRSSLVDQFGRPLSPSTTAAPALVDASGRPLTSAATAAPSLAASQSGGVPAPSMGSFGWQQAGSKATQAAETLAAHGASSGAGPVSGDPLLFQNERMSQVKKEEKQAYEYFATLSQQLRTAPAESWANFDPQAQLAAHQSWLKSTQLLGTKADLPSIEQMAQDIERGFWAQWVNSVHPIVDYVTVSTTYPNLGSGVSGRLKALGIAGQAGLELSGFSWFSHGYLFYESTYDDWQKLKKWAGTFMPRVFLPSK